MCSHPLPTPPSRCFPLRSRPAAIGGLLVSLALAACSTDHGEGSEHSSDAAVSDITLGGDDVANDDTGDDSDLGAPEDTADSTSDTGDDAAGDTAVDDPEIDASTVDTTDDAAADTADTNEPIDTAGEDTRDGPPTAAECFADQLGESGELMVDYDALGAVVGSHCLGTNHQDIESVERVIFAGDSITVGTPPTLTGQYYRNRLAAALATRFGLAPPNILWQTADVINGVSVVRESGDFASCAKWGARTDDITSPPHMQIQTCAPEEERDKITLIVMTIGGNDFFAWAQDLVDGVSIETVQAAAEQMVADLETSVHWITDEPSPFPNGVFVVFATNFEFTDVDSANDFATCPGADIISMDSALVDPRLDAIGARVMGEYMRIAVETGTDVIFMGETFCGHGHMRDDPDGRCYRGPGAELWLDITCMHPSGLGHAAIADMFMAVIDE